MSRGGAEGPVANDQLRGALASKVSMRNLARWSGKRSQVVRRAVTGGPAGAYTSKLNRSRSIDSKPPTFPWNIWIFIDPPCLGICVGVCGPVCVSVWMYVCVVRCMSVCIICDYVYECLYYVWLCVYECVICGYVHVCVL